MNKEALAKSIVLNGPVGSGKSLLSRVLSKTLGYPVISTDVFRQLPSKSMSDLFDKFSLNELDIIFAKMGINPFYFKDNPEKVSSNEALEIAKKAIQDLRKILPNVRNYYEMGFSLETSNSINSEFGPVAWHFYQKQFEITLLKEIIENIDTPVILDLGGGAAISLDRDYAKLEKMARQLDNSAFERAFKLRDAIGFDKIKSLLENFDNVVYLELPEDLSNMPKAANDKLNPIFRSTNQYEITATQTVPVAQMLGKDGKPSFDMVAKTADIILSQCKNIEINTSLATKASEEKHNPDGDGK